MQALRQVADETAGGAGVALHRLPPTAWVAAAILATACAGQAGAPADAVSGLDLAGAAGAASSASGLETARQALFLCTSDSDCPPADLCETARCIAGECRYLLSKPGCCVDDTDCVPDTDCSFGYCVFADLTGEGTCSYYPDLDKFGCCSFPSDCGTPPPGFVAACELDPLAGYKSCSFVPDPNLCASPANQIVINEFMANPAAAEDGIGEWIELFNPSLAPVNINGWSLEDNDADAFTIVSGSPVVVPPGGYFILARSDNKAKNGNIAPDFVYYNFTLANLQDEIVLVNAAGSEVDRVEYGAMQFVPTDGASLELVSPYFNNLDPANWRTAKNAPAPGLDKGTPGKPNADAFFFYFTPAVCNDDDPCTFDTCGKGGQSVCAHTPIDGCCLIDSQCNDGNACTQDSCDGNSLSCIHSFYPGCCIQDADCNDGNPCTLKSCVNGKCRVTPDPELPGCCTQDSDCKDSNPCSIDFCSQSPGVPYKTCHYNSPGGKQCCNYDWECNDNKAETVDVCNSYVCFHQANPEYCKGPPPDYCDDGNPCTVDSCDLAKNLCSHAQDPDCCASDADCNDNDPCTQDNCLGAIHACDHPWIPWCCHEAADCLPYMTDKELCKEPVCVVGKCRLQHLPDPNCCLTSKDCDDGDACTTDVCDPGNNTCSHSPLGKGCCNTVADCVEDADPCTKLICLSHTCINQPREGCCKAAFECEDGNPCTADLCIDYSCRYLPPKEGTCCMTDADCQQPGPACAKRTCAPNHACVQTTDPACSVAPDWLETFAASETLAPMGWSSESDGAIQFVVAPGTGLMGIDHAAALLPDPGTGPLSACLVSPRVVPPLLDVYSLTFEQLLDVDTSSASAPFEAYVEIRVEGAPSPLRLATFGGPVPGSVEPYALTLPTKASAAPSRIAFCVTVPEGASLSAWYVDSVRVGHGHPPEIVGDLPDLFLLFNASVTVHADAVDPDQDWLVFSLAGPAHVSMADKSSAPAPFVDLLLEPAGKQDEGEWPVVLSVTDGFFYDRHRFLDTVYIPKCESVEECDDANGCSVDSCNPLTGCLHEFIPGCCNELTPCDDADACTVDTCIGGSCEFSAQVCDDANLCTDDTCDPAVGCVFTDNNAACDDGSVCTWQDQCVGGKCAGLTVDCSDEFPCTVDTCNPATGCQHKSACGDNILCTTDLCTVKGCKTGKAPVGSPTPDGVIDEQWPPSSVAGGGGLHIGEVAFLQDEADLYSAFSVSAPPAASFVFLLDTDFPAGTGVHSLVNVDPGDTPLAAPLAGQLSVLFPGFGADFVVGASWGEEPLLGAEMTGCATLDAAGVAAESLCLVAQGAEGRIELVVPWLILYPEGPLSGKTIAAVLALFGPDGSLLEAVPTFAPGGTVDDVIVFGIPDAKCLTAFCGDGTVDQGEECDNGDANSDTVPNACRTDCLQPWCGDTVHDTGEECDDGQANSDTVPDACRTSCVLPKCGDGVTDAGEQCDEGAANDNLPDHCRPTCVKPACGDGILDSMEQCDNGPDNNDALPDTCRSTCLLAYCGDGIVDTGEQCDLGLANSDVVPNVCRTTCQKAHCGDGVTDFGEQCDWGTLNSDSVPDACRTSCKKAACGDGALDTGEQCDDGNTEDWDGCQSDCAILLTVCGDGVPTPNEECDDGVSNSDTLPDACRTNCMNSYCGDGVKDSDELCDDGNTQGGDSCGLDCKPYVASCGNSWIDPGEQCDDGPANSNVLPDHCRKTCVLPKCGDLVVDSGEQCDKGPGNSDVAPNTCRTNCLKPHCGDKVVDTGEQCDAGTANSDVNSDACRTSCKLPTCGDGVTDVGHGEQCDWGPLNSDSIPDACRTDCKAAACGDGILDSTEECDDGNTSGKDGCSQTCDVEAYLPEPGDIIISEIMQNPSVVYDSDGEYVELYNTTNVGIDIRGWDLSDAISDFHTISSPTPVVVPSHGYLVLGINSDMASNGGVLVGYVYDNFLLGNSSDEVILSSKGLVSDQVKYDGGPAFPDPKGASMSLSPSKLNATANDQGSNWCLSKSKLPGGDYGTPFMPNDPCQ